MSKPGHARFPHLFSPGRLGPYQVKNRVKYAAC